MLIVPLRFAKCAKPDFFFFTLACTNYLFIFDEHASSHHFWEIRLREIYRFDMRAHSQWKLRAIKNVSNAQKIRAFHRKTDSILLFLVLFRKF